MLTLKRNIAPKPRSCITDFFSPHHFISTPTILLNFWNLCGSSLSTDYGLPLTHPWRFCNSSPPGGLSDPCLLCFANAWCTSPHFNFSMQWRMSISHKTLNSMKGWREFFTLVSSALSLVLCVQQTHDGRNNRKKKRSDKPRNRKERYHPKSKVKCHY